MGIITLALITHGTLAKGSQPPLWVIAAAALAMALGTAIGGWRVIRTLGRGIFHVEPPQGFAAEASSTSVILSSAFFGYPLSTTHVVSGSVMGAGIGKRLAEIRWGVIGRMVGAWLITIPAAAAVGAVAWGVADKIGGQTGALIVFAGLLATGAGFYALANRKPVNSENVNDEWTGDLSPAQAVVPAAA
jgi:PiT family inorganic phosphate transporter